MGGLGAARPCAKARKGEAVRKKETFVFSSPLNLDVFIYSKLCALS
jgi:hypothetical protein